jgi:hypothetical protein
MSISGHATVGRPLLRRTSIQAWFSSSGLVRINLGMGLDIG